MIILILRLYLNTMYRRKCRTQELSYLLVGVKNSKTALENSLLISYEVNIRLLYDWQLQSFIDTFKSFLEKKYAYACKKTCKQTFIAVLLATAKNQKQVKCPCTGEEIKKKCVLIEYTSA